MKEYVGISKPKKHKIAILRPIQLIVLVIITQVLSVINGNNLVFSQIPFLLICPYRFYHRWTKSLETNKWVCNDHRDIPQCFPQDKY